MIDRPDEDQGGPFARMAAFASSRAVDESGQEVDPEQVAAERKAELDAFRELLAQQQSDSLVPGPPPGPNWISIGPAAVLNGQTVNQAVVSGRVPGLAVSNDGQRIYAASANGGVWASRDAGRSWRPKSDELDLDPTAQRNVDTLACGAIALVDGGSADQDRLYVGTGEAFPSVSFMGVGPLTSRNGGNSWEKEDAFLVVPPVPPPPANLSLLGRGFFAIAADPGDSEHVIGATNRGLFRRTLSNGNPAWNQQVLPAPVSNSRSATSIVAHRAGGTTTWYAAVEGGPIITATGSGTDTLTWGLLPGSTGFPTSNVGRITLAVSSSSPAVLYALVAQLSNPPAIVDSLIGVFRLDVGDAPPTWRQVTGVPDTLFGEGSGQQGSYDQALVVDPTRSDLFYVGGSYASVSGDYPAGIYRCEVRTRGSGTSRTYRTSAKSIGASAHADVHALVLAPNKPKELWVGCDGGVFVAADATTNGNSVFEARNTGLVILTPQSFTHHPTLSGFAFAGVQDNGGTRYGGDEVWDHQQGGDGGDTVMAWSNPTTPGRILNIYTRTSIRSFRTDSDRYSEQRLGPDLFVPPTGSGLTGETSEFYPPLVGPPPDATPAHANRVAIGTERVWISDNFGNDPWVSVPPSGAATAAAAFAAEQLTSGRVKSMAFASHTRLYVGSTTGDLWQYDQGATWSRVRHGRPPLTPGFPLLSITVDPAVPGGSAVYCTYGGPGAHTRVWHWNSARPAAAQWQARGAGLPQSPINTLAVDPNNNATLYVGADIGVWRSTTSGIGATPWAPFSNNLPDAAVINLDISRDGALLRAATHGRGAFEIPLGGVAQPAVQLRVRANRVDTGRASAPSGMPDPFDLSRNLTVLESPDIRCDAPDRRGRLKLDPAVPVDPVLFTTELPTAGTILANTSETVATTKIYVRVANLGPGEADGVAVTLLLGRVTGGARPALPAGFDAAVRAGTEISSADWQTIGRRTVDGVAPARPGFVSFDLGSDLLPPVSQSEGDDYVLLALVDHPSDRFALPAATVVTDTVVTGARHAALTEVKVAAARGAAASGEVNPPAGSGGSGSGTTSGGSSGGASGGAGPSPSLLVPVATAMLTHKRLTDAVEGLERKIGTARIRSLPDGPERVRVQPVLGGFSRSSQSSRVEHQVLGLARRALEMYGGGPAAPLPRHSLATGISSFALLGTLGFELPRNLALLKPGGDWIATTMHRGTADPNRSHVKVPTSEFAVAAGTPPTGASDDIRARVQAFGMGALAATAAGVVVNPQLADLLAAETNRDWNSRAASVGAAATDELIMRRILSDVNRTSLVGLWPSVDEVPTELWTGYLAAIGSTYNIPENRIPGFADFEEGFEQGEWPTVDRLSNAYAVFRDDLATSVMPWGGWFGWLTMYTIASPLGLLISRALPNAKGIFEPNTPVDERAWFELMMVSMGMGSIGPFISSMYLWSQVDEHTGVFVNALILFLARAGLTATAIGTAGRDMDELGRWLGMFLPMVGTDVYAGIRSAAAGGNPAGDRIVYGLQLNSIISGLCSLAVGAITKKVVDEADEEWPGWLIWGLHTLGMSLGLGIGLAQALKGSGWRSWFLRDGDGLSLISGIEGAELDPAEPRALGRVFDDSTLWEDPKLFAGNSDIARHAYPSGMRALIRVWFDPAIGSLQIRHDGSEITLRPSAGGEQTVVLPFEGVTPDELVDLLKGALAGVDAEVISATDPLYRLPSPDTLADPGDVGPIADHQLDASRFKDVGGSREEAYILRHTPRAEVTSRAGLAGPGGSDLDAASIVPQSTLGDLEASGLGAAADAALLLSLGAVPTLDGGTFTVADDDWDAVRLAAGGRQIEEVSQAFRRWNLDERRANEWYQLVSGQGQNEKKDQPGIADPLMRPYPVGRSSPAPEGAALATAMGWVPLWRAWLRIATDPGLDAEADVAMPFTPVVRNHDGSRARPTNHDLTTAVRFILDLEE